MHKKLLGLGLILGGISIVLGAFASHGLENLIAKEAIETFETGVRYQMYQALFLIGVSFYKALLIRQVNLIFWLNLIGVLCFSGSIYGLATNELSSFDFKTIALVTPLGGLMLIIVWFYTAYLVYKKNK
ncbi:DUF423 domain-containing protein [Psychroflexus sp. ALD_RP9]|uniref:DUF423 domain-containing protein n=1 Tax=Psychroflexus sp. ALD_RP9 TaxID=2777186 RepID=UPI001A90211D|nr:DUF423 domain-containing protein [Psychroflexus sp. ALD_RP9]QSS96175.1 DUF423 domain-containing protein [Psychroflexus sp. ALD_RP9]